MEKFFTKALGLVLVTAMLLSVIPPLSFAAPNDSIYVVPEAGINLSTASVSVGYEFYIELWATSTKNVGAWSARLAYVDTILLWLNGSYTNADHTQSEFFDNISTVPVSPVHVLHNATCHRVDFGESWAGSGPTRDPGYGSLCRYYFRVIAAPVKGGNINSYFDVHSSDIPHAGAGAKTYMIDAASVKFGIGVDAAYNYVWAPPPAAYLTASPINNTFDWDHDWPCTRFNVTISIHVDTAWYLTSLSFRVTFDPTFLEVTNNYIVDPVWNADSHYTINNIAGYDDVFLYTTGTVGPVTIAKIIEFHIISQKLYPSFDYCLLDFTNVVIWDHIQEIPHGTDTEAFVKVWGRRYYALPDLEVLPSVTYFELPPAGTTFSVDVAISDLHKGWKLVGIEFRLQYDDEWLEVVSVDIPGPYLTAYAPNGMWQISYLETPPPHVLVGELILPYPNGTWLPPFPGDDPETGPLGDGVVATINFRTLKALSGPGVITLPLHLFNARFVTADGLTMNFEPLVDGVVILNDHITTGRVIDIYGGACDAGYGPAPEPWPAPYGGQGQGMPMEIVIPQSCVCLYADVLYNGWPVQQKDVNIEVEGPYLHLYNETSQEWYYVPAQGYMILLKLSARTNETGQIKICFAMPWPCDDPESLLGVWKVTATVNIRDVVVTDTMYYYYDYMVHIWKVTTDKYFYKHCENIYVTVEYGSHAMLTYPGLVSVVIMDDLMVPFMGLADITIGGATFCTYKNGSVTIPIHVMKWWFVGFADIYVNIFDKDPTIGGFNWYKQVFLDDEIYILPEWA
jgi:hypothetical protein